MFTWVGAGLRFLFAVCAKGTGGIRERHLTCSEEKTPAGVIVKMGDWPFLSRSHKKHGFCFVLFTSEGLISAHQGVTET